MRMKDGFVKTGKKLGVIGGMGPAASAEFLHILTKKSPAEIDQEHAVVYMIADTELPDRSSAILGKGADPSAQLRSDFDKLAALGAPEFGFIQQQAGMFSYSGLSKAQVDRLREEYAIYAIGTGRICVAALSQNNLDKVAEAVYAVSRG